MGHVVVATWVAKPGEADYVRTILEKMTPGNRAEEKMVHFQAQVSTEDPNVFIVYEHYTDASGYEEHRASEAFQNLVLGDVIHRLESRAVRTYTTIGPRA
ncbi:quinol monooxygenase YgiN [Nocardia transvalensis]|uniref:Quinol monooxygenase YgiN n=1 Tax=Nocardia transvalensis TaxID=37333 RepID=A0A7W9PI66_9NOCA|nr:antibiotic biosynthesis monooxygenase [Nocardia transvalensis]MBB5916614.1 quinol monooxygenase YgiN [Nocardia transvalensis]